MPRPIRLAALVLLAAVSVGADWPQWGRDPGHGAAAPVPAQPLGAILADYVYDPFVPLAQAEAGGDLLAHYPVPLVDGSDVYMETKTGEYVSCNPPGSRTPAPCGPGAWDTQIWNVAKLSWKDGALQRVWLFQTDWKPPADEGQHFGGWEPVFHPALAGGFLWVPGAGGSVFRVDKATGNGVRFSPFGALDPSYFVAGGLAAGPDGQIYYDAVRLSTTTPWSSDALGSWLVAVASDGTMRKTAFGSLISGAPAPTDRCETSFASASQLPFPPSPTAVPPTTPCGSQRAGWNVIPAVGADGTIYTVSRAHFSTRYGYLVAVDSSLHARWAASLRDRLHDGCGVLLPPNGMPGGCRDGTTIGVDPATNNVPAGPVSDLGTSSPVVLPDGSVLQGVATRYNYARGHLLRFDPSGAYVGSYDFGWDVTPAVRLESGGGWTVFSKDNHYDVGSYCSSPTLCPPEAGRYDIVALDESLRPRWTFTSVNTESCSRASDGSITCVPDHAEGFEWCINQPAVDADGVVYANSEDGWLYGIGPDGHLAGRIFLNLAIGAAYTPLSIGGDGIVYTQNDGHLFAVGNAPRATPLPPPRRARRP